MGKKVERDCPHVVVYPDSRWSTPEERHAEDIKDQIKRHVDGLGYVAVEFDIEETCEFCGGIWDQPTDVHNGGCCDEDAENMPDEEG